VSDIQPCGFGHQFIDVLRIDGELPEGGDGGLLARSSTEFGLCGVDGSRSPNQRRAAAFATGCNRHRQLTGDHLVAVRSKPHPNGCLFACWPLGECSNDRRKPVGVGVDDTFRKRAVDELVGTDAGQDLETTVDRRKPSIVVEAEHCLVDEFGQHLSRLVRLRTGFTLAVGTSWLVAVVSIHGYCVKLSGDYNNYSKSSFKRL